MKPDTEKKLDIVSGIDEALVDRVTAKKIALTARASRLRVRRLLVSVAAALLLVTVGLSTFRLFLPTDDRPVYTGMSLSETNPLHPSVAAEGSLFLSIGDSDIARDRNHGRPSTSDEGTLPPPVSTDPPPSVESGADLFTCRQGEDFYITVHIDNPKNYEIMSFTLNGEKYTSYMFEEGSDMENLVLKCNVGDATGIVEYTIDAIKYIDGTTIKDVDLKGEQTVRIGVYDPTSLPQVAVKITAKVPFSLDGSITVTDEKGALSYGSYELFVALRQNGKELARLPLALGENQGLIFSDLFDATLYELAVFGAYDAFDGNGYCDHLLYSVEVRTEEAVTVALTPTYHSVSYLLSSPLGAVTVQEAYLLCDGERVTEASAEGTTFDRLMSETAYTLVLTYRVNGQEATRSFPFRTAAATVPTLKVTGQSSTVDSISFLLTETDPSDIGQIEAVELYRDNVLLSSLDIKNSYHLTDLDAPYTYTVRIRYAYDRRNGLGKITETVTYTAVTQSVGLEIKNHTIVGPGTCTDPILYINMPVSDGALDDCDFLRGIFCGASTGSVANIKGCDNLRFLYLPKDVVYLDPPEEFIIYTVEGYDPFEAQGFYYLGLFQLPYNLPASDYRIEQNDYLTLVRDGKKELVCYLGTKESLSVPASLGLETIGHGAFAFSYLESVTLPAGVTELGPFAFCYARYLNKVSLPGGLTTIGHNAFSDCNRLTQISLPATVKSIGPVAFASTGLTSIVLPEGITVLEDSVFANCASLVTVKLPSTLREIRYGVFNQCHNLRDLILPEGLVSIGKIAFQSCYSLRENGDALVLPSTLTIVGEHAFQHCRITLYVPLNVTTVGTTAFSGCRVYAAASSRPTGWHRDFDYEAEELHWNAKPDDAFDEKHKNG